MANKLAKGSSKFAWSRYHQPSGNTQYLVRVDTEIMGLHVPAGKSRKQTADALRELRIFAQEHRILLNVTEAGFYYDQENKTVH